MAASDCHGRRLDTSPSTGNVFQKQFLQTLRAFSDALPPALSIGNVSQKQFLKKLYFFGGQGLDSANRTRSGSGAGTSPATRATPPELSEPTPELPEPPCNSYLTSRL